MLIAGKTALVTGAPTGSGAGSRRNCGGRCPRHRDGAQPGPSGPRPVRGFRSDRGGFVGSRRCRRGVAGSDRKTDRRARYNAGMGATHDFRQGSPIRPMMSAPSASISMRRSGSSQG
jgi:hypothetical protein